MSKPKQGEQVKLWDHREKKAVNAKVYKVSETHVTVVYSDGKMGCMTLNDYQESKR